ncbi:M48 family metalloprotease [Micromonospora sp. NPDC047134]|uniref:M48 family metalloprotease n=1 Tax=Micromonospora sp. NPDC047134 TaxID=3154340 RepID=UPI003407D741
MRTERRGAQTLRLSPDALPHATTGRFILLVVTALASAGYLYAWLVEQHDTISSAPLYCVHGAQATPAVPPELMIDWYGGCVRWLGIREALVVAEFTGLFVAATVLVYLALPWLSSRGLVAEDDASAYVPPEAWTRYRTALPAGRLIPKLYVDLAPVTGGARAYGRIGDYRIVVDSAVLAKEDTTALRRFLAHEMVHLNNRDVDLTYAAVAVWWTFVPFTLLPLVLVAWRQPALLGDFSWRVCVLLGMLYLVRAMVLRTREFYADVGSVRSPAEEAELVAALSLRAAPVTGPWWRRLAASRRRWNHPAVEIRHRTLLGDDRLFRVDRPGAASVGLLVGMAYLPADYLLSLALPNSANLRGWICGAMFGALIATIITGAVWRSTLWELAGGRRPAVSPIALSFVGGLLLGQVLTPRLPGLGGWAALATGSPSLAAVTAVLLFAGCVAYLRWTRFAARQWLPLSGRPRLAYRFGVVQSAVVVGVWIAFWFQIVELLPAGGRSWQTFAVLVLSVSLNPVLVLTIVWGCGYPLLVWQTRRMAARAAEIPLSRDTGTVIRLPIARPAWPPWLGAAAFAVVVAVGYWLIVRPFYPDLRGALQLLWSNGDLPAAGRVALALTIPALAVCLPAAAALGGVLGGRGRTATAVASAGSGLVLATIGVLVLILVHIGSVSDRPRPVLTTLRGISGYGLGADLPDDRPAYAALGLMLMVLYALLAAVTLPAAALGSGVRALAAGVESHPTRRPSGLRPGWLLSALPAVAAALMFGYLSVDEWSVPQTTSIVGDFDLSGVNVVLGDVRPGSAPRSAACAQAFGTAAGPVGVGETLTAVYAVRLATLARWALSSDDVTLRRAGEGTAQALRRRELQRAADGAAVVLHYCAVAETVRR